MKEYLKRQENLLIILAGERIDPSLISLAGFHLVLGPTLQGRRVSLLLMHLQFCMCQK